MLYCETTAFEVLRLMLATPPRTCGTDVVDAVIGRFCSSLRVSTWYCGVCMTIGYCTPFLGSNQNVGATWLLPASITSMLLVTSRSVRPRYCACARSTLTLKPGLLGDSWIRASATPGTRRTRPRSSAAYLKFAARSGPRTCRSIGAGEPKFRI